MIEEIEVRLEDDSLGRKFKITTDREFRSEARYPCNGCRHAVFNEDHFCCRLLPHHWTEFDGFKGTDAYPSKELRKKTNIALSRPLDYPKEDVVFYDCESKNK